MNLQFIGEFEQLEIDYLKEQFKYHPELIKQEMEITDKIISASKKENNS